MVACGTWRANHSPSRSATDASLPHLARRQSWPWIVLTTFRPRRRAMGDMRDGPDRVEVNDVVPADPRREGGEEAVDGRVEMLAVDRREADEPHPSVLGEPGLGVVRPSEDDDLVARSPRGARRAPPRGVPRRRGWPAPPSGRSSRSSRRLDRLLVGCQHPLEVQRHAVLPARPAPSRLAERGGVSRVVVET